MSENAVLLPLDGGERIENRLCGEIVFKARAAQTGGSLTVFEAVNLPGQRTHRPAHSYSSRAGAAHMGGARRRSRPLAGRGRASGSREFLRQHCSGRRWASR